MRILFTFIEGNGHFVPLISVARAALVKGHTVALGCGPSMVATVEAAGFAALPVGTGAARPPERLPLRPLDPAREDREFRTLVINKPPTNCGMNSQLYPTRRMPSGYWNGWR